MKHLIKNSIVLSLLSVVSNLTLAATDATSSMNVNASISPTCILTSNDNIQMDLTPEFDGEGVSGSSISALCTNNTPYTIRFSEGGSGSYTQRNMSGQVGNTDKLKYQLYLSDGTLSKILGDGSGGTFNFTGVGAGYEQSYFYKSKIINNQFVKPDLYTDTITVTLQY